MRSSNYEHYNGIIKNHTSLGQGEFTLYNTNTSIVSGIKHKHYAVFAYQFLVPVLNRLKMWHNIVFILWHYSNYNLEGSKWHLSSEHHWYLRSDKDAITRPPWLNCGWWFGSLTFGHSLFVFRDQSRWSVATFSYWAAKSLGIPWTCVQKTIMFMWTNCPEVTLCGWQDIKIQSLTNYYVDSVITDGTWDFNHGNKKTLNNLTAIHGIFVCRFTYIYVTCWQY